MLVGKAEDHMGYAGQLWLDRQISNLLPILQPLTFIVACLLQKAETQ